MTLEWPDEMIEKSIVDCIADDAVFIVDWRLQNRRGDWELRLKCDADHGITLDQVATINRALRDSFQLPNLDTESLSIEVSSPGITYPIRTERHFRRYLGHQIKIEHDLPTVANPVLGEIVAAENKRIILKHNEAEIELPLANIKSGHLQLKW